MRLRFLVLPAVAVVACLSACGGKTDSPAASASPEAPIITTSSAVPTTSATPGGVNIPSGGAGGASGSPSASDMVDGGELGAIEPNLSSQQVLTERFTDAKIKDAAKIAAVIKKAGPFTPEDYKTKITAALKKNGYSQSTINTVLKQLAF